MVEAGSNVTLECATNGSDSSITWTYDALVVANSPCRSQDSRFVATSVANGCFLTALGSNSIQGPYTCQIGGHGNKAAQAAVIVIGKIVHAAVECSHVLPYAIQLVT